MFSFCVKRAVSFADMWSNQGKFCCTEILFRVCLVDRGLRGNAYKSCFPRVPQNFIINVEIAWRTPWGFAIGLSGLQVLLLWECVWQELPLDSTWRTIKTWRAWPPRVCYVTRNCITWNEKKKKSDIHIIDRSMQVSITAWSKCFFIQKMWHSKEKKTPGHH